MHEEINKPFPLDGPQNVRELGGYATQDGRRTKKHVFVRADGLDTLTGRDRNFLRQYPVGLVIDLRSAYEARLRPDRLKRQFETMHVPMFDHVQSEMARRIEEGEIDKAKPVTSYSLEEIYVLLAETEQKEIYTVLKTLIDTDKPALFHCTAGKDRTGTIAMLLLEMAGVPEETILADYAATAEYFGNAYGFSDDGESAQEVFRSQPATMQYLRRHLAKRYGSIRNYLHAVGITGEDIRKLREKFTEQMQ